MKELPILIAILVSAVCSNWAVGENADRPNVIIINADDLGYGDLSCHGATKISTPHIDRLAQEGRRFTDAHSASAVCSPSRYGLLTGEYPLRRNLWGPIGLRLPLSISPQQTTLGSLMKKAGYNTACIGKWHLGFGLKEPDWNGELKPGPLELGFDDYFGIPSVNSGPPFVFVDGHHVVGKSPTDPFVYGKKSVTRKILEKSGYNAIGGAEDAHHLYVDDQIATTLKNKATQWIRRQNADKPFFLYLATTNIHHPFTPSPQFIGTSECGRYGDFIHELDWVVGDVLKTLDELNLSENTMVIFTSDNGGMLNGTAQKAWRSGHHINGDLLGFKFGAWEGGHRVPFIVRWPNRVPKGTTSDQLISQVDLFATLAAMTGVSLNSDQGRDSINQLTSLTGSPQAPIRTTLVVSPNSPKHLTVRKGPWVYIPAPGAGGFQGKKLGDHLFSGTAALPFVGRINSDVINGKRAPNAPIAQLYNLDDDPQQTNNVIAQHDEIAKSLQNLLKRYRAEIPAGPPIGWINLKQ